MKNTSLMNFEDPSESEMVKLMKEVAEEARQKSLVAQKKLAEKIKNLISEIIVSN